MVMQGSQSTCGCCCTLGVVERHQGGLGIDQEPERQVGIRAVGVEQTVHLAGSLEEAEYR